MLQSFYNSSQITDLDKWAQINTLKMFNERVEEIDPGRIYKVPFKSGNSDFYLKIELSDTFPDQKPILVIEPIASHQWIDDISGEIVSAPGLLSFTKHSDLGRVVYVIIREFVKTPLNLLPKIRNRNDMQSLTKSLMDLEIDPNECISYSNAYFNSESYRQSDLYPELNAMTIEELQSFHNYSDLELEQFLTNNNYKKLITNKKTEILHDINQIIEENLLKENEYNALKSEVCTRKEQLKNALRNFESKQHEYNSLSEKYTPINICKLLESETKKIDCSSESVATRFLNNQLSLDSFLNEYIHMRSLFYIRKSKEDRLTSQLKELKKFGF